MITYSELGLGEVVVVCFGVFIEYLLRDWGRPQKVTARMVWIPSQHLNRAPPKYKSEALPLEQTC
jgi:hypothetical protein